MKIPLQVETELLKVFHPITIKNQHNLICGMLKCGAKRVSIQNIIEEIRYEYEN